MGMKRVTVANVRKFSIAGHIVDVPMYVHRNVSQSGWTVSIAGIKKYFGDKAYGGMMRALGAAKVFLAEVVRQDRDTLLQYAQINVIAYSPKDGKSAVHACFKDATTGKDIMYRLGSVEPGIDFWPQVSFAIQDVPVWLSCIHVNYSEVLDAWFSMHRNQMNHIYHRDDFKKFLDEILSKDQQAELAF